MPVSKNRKKNKKLPQKEIIRRKEQRKNVLVM